METLRKREFKFLAQMVVIEISVMFFEVMFLYRQFIDALTPWIAQETGVVLGLRATMSLAAFGWVGIRAMTWFLFAAVRDRAAAGVHRPPPPGRCRGARDVRERTGGADGVVAERAGRLQAGAGVAHTKGDQLLEYLALPASSSWRWVSTSP